MTLFFTTERKQSTAAVAEGLVACTCGQ